jgi:small subunit ribosomal protein S8
MSFDQIADMLTRIRNAQMAGNVEVSMPASNFKISIAKLLHQKGYLEEVAIFTEKEKRYLKLKLKYLENSPAIAGIKQRSKQGQRIYVSYRDIPRVKDGQGVAVISTPGGVLSGDDAKKKKLGGEYVCDIW